MEPQALFIFPNFQFQLDPCPAENRCNDGTTKQYGDPFYAARGSDGIGEYVVYWPLHDPYNAHVAIKGTPIGDCAIHAIEHNRLPSTTP